MTEWLRASTCTEKSESTTKKLGKSSYLFSTGYSRTTFPEPRFVRARLSLPTSKQNKSNKKIIKWMPKNSFLISSPVNFLFQHLEPCCSKKTEWQKRGLPHAHILIWLVERIQPDQIDDIIIMCWDSRSRSRSRPTWCCNHKYDSWTMWRNQSPITLHDRREVLKTISTFFYLQPILIYK